jgi:hypothetical protein
MKKSVPFLMLAAFSLGAFAQNYWYLRTFGTTQEYNNRNATAPVAIEATASLKAKQLTATQTIPFTWNFYGTPVTFYKISTSGYITFNTSQTADSNNNVALPSAEAPIGSIFAFWDNLRIVLAAGVNPAFPQGVRTWTYGTAPNRVHVIQWQLAQKDDGSASGLNNIVQFAIRLYETGDATKFDVVHNFGGGTFNATVGVQGLLQSQATMVSGSPNMNYGGATGGDVPSEAAVYTFNFGNGPRFDLALVDLETVNYIQQGDAVDVGYRFRNDGLDTIKSFRVNYSVNGGTVVSQNVNTSITGSGMEEFSATHNTPYIAVAGTNTLKLWIDNINGANSNSLRSNDTLTNTIIVGTSSFKRKALHEVFTSSTCPPCRPGNIVVQDVFHQRMGGYTVIKYQYSFPGLGDPYYTPEVGLRGQFYGGINSVPSLLIDGQWKDNANGYSTALFDQFYSKPALVQIKGSQTIGEKSITLNAKIKPTDAMNTNLRVFFAVVEKETTKNVENNGETEFHWVMKKMLPNAEGIPISFTSTNEQTFSQTWNIPGSYRLPASAINGNTGAYNGINLTTENTVEEVSDLIGVVFVQDMVSGEVLQSEWTGNNEWDYLTSVNDESVNSNATVQIYPNPAQQSVTINTSQIKEEATVTLFDITGKGVLTTTVGAGIEKSVDCSNLNNGVYLVQIKTAGSTTTQKLVIQK